MDLDFEFMQPLSKVRPKCKSLKFGDDTIMIHRLELAVAVAECIAKWASIETLLGILLALLMKADAKTALAIHAALDNRAAQLRALNAAAKEKLSKSTQLLYEAVITAHVRPTMRERDKFAHWCWGYSSELPKALLLMRPEEKARVHMRYANTAQSHFDKQKIFVITSGDLGRFEQRLDRTGHLLTRLMACVWEKNSPQWRASLCRRLSSEPDIREVVVRLRGRRQKNPEAPE